MGCVIEPVNTKKSLIVSGFSNKSYIFSQKIFQGNASVIGYRLKISEKSYDMKMGSCRFFDYFQNFMVFAVCNNFLGNNWLYKRVRFWTYSHRYEWFSVVSRNLEFDDKILCWINSRFRSISLCLVSCVLNFKPMYLRKVGAGTDLYNDDLSLRKSVQPD